MCLHYFCREKNKKNIFRCIWFDFTYQMVLLLLKTEVAKVKAEEWGATRYLKTSGYPNPEVQLRSLRQTRRVWKNSFWKQHQSLEDWLTPRIQRADQSIIVDSFSFLVLRLYFFLWAWAKNGSRVKDPFEDISNWSALLCIY